MCAKKLAITYDIDLDFKIINTVDSANGGNISINNLRNYLEIHSSRLQEHIKYLENWNMLVDKKPERNGKARIISLARPFFDVSNELMELRTAINIVNHYF